MPTTFVQLETKKSELLDLLGRWPEEYLLFRPADGGWSAVQVVDHLVRTEVEIVAAARRGLAQPHRIGARDRAGTWFLQRVFESDRKVKAPGKVTAIMPADAPSLSECAQRWEQARRELAALEACVNTAVARQGIFRHPVGGWMTLDGVRDFFAVHIHHHGFQLAALERTAKVRS